MFNIIDDEPLASDSYVNWDAKKSQLYFINLDMYYDVALDTLFRYEEDCIFICNRGSPLYMAMLPSLLRCLKAVNDKCLVLTKTGLRVVC